MFEEDKNVIQFLKQYEKICNIYGYQICACGCCNSPYLNHTIGDYEIEDIEIKESELIFTLIKRNEEGKYITYKYQTIKDLESKCKEYYKEMNKNEIKN